MRRRKRHLPTGINASLLRRVASLALLIGAALVLYCSSSSRVANEQAAVAPPPRQPRAAAAPAATPPPSAPIDEESRANFKYEAELIVDRATSMHPTEMPAYQRVLNWVGREDFASLDSRAQAVTFHDLIKNPARHRGEVIGVDLAIRRVLEYESSGGKLYELWGWPVERNGWLYVVVTPQLPPGMAVGNSVEATVRVAGYFFKLQGYYPADAKPNSRLLVAPLLVGRAQLERRPLVARNESGWFFPLLLVAVIVSLTLTTITLLRAFRARRRNQPAAVPIDRLGPRPVDDAIDDAKDDADDPADDIFAWINE